ncbi:MAG: hypothetical protein JSV44_10510 [Candidatus Zixiibacteriota bacterium]|nr:MAG: hypothetical protein JSV44_10510 [candidate division Zixibacteria bacterium]
MSFVILNRFIGLYLNIFRTLLSFRLWLPFLLYAILQFLVLLACRYYTHPALYSILSAPVSLLGERQAEIFSHYPGLFILLPTVVQWGKLLIGVIFEGLIIGIGSVLFMRRFDSAGTGPEDRVSAAFSRWMLLQVVWVAITIILLLINWLLPTMLSEYLILSPRRQFVFGIMLRLITVFAFSVFIYAVPSVMVYKNSIAGALKGSVLLFSRYPIFSFFLALVPYLLSVPVSYLLENTPAIVNKFAPVLVFYILTVGIIIDMIINYFVTGTVVKFLLDEKR